MSLIVLAFVLLVSQGIGKVESSFDKKADFSAFRTYGWNKGHEAYNREAHKTIVDAIDAQMASLGYTKTDAKSADVVVKYHTVRSSDVDLKVLEKVQKSGQAGPAPEDILGNLLVVLYRNGSSTPLWEARTRRHFSADAAVRTGEIQQAVQSLFDTYPRRGK